VTLSTTRAARYSERRERFYPLGYPVDVISSSADAIALAAISWSAWPQLFSEEPIRLTIDATDSVAELDPKLYFGVSAQQLDFRLGDSAHAVFDCATHEIRIRASAAILEDTARFRRQFLDTVILTALDHFFFTPLHAACIVRNGKGVLLCGDSGAGKSTLTYTCVRKEGWTLVSDDAVHAVRSNVPMVVGFSGPIHLRKPAQAFFPELANEVPVVSYNGKQAIPVQAANFARASQADGVVFLSRRPGPARIKPYSTDQALAYFLKYLWHREPGAEPHLRKLLQPGAVLLEYEHPEDARRALEDLTE
jgi:hypothetical protein